MMRSPHTPSRSRDASAPGFCGERSALLQRGRAERRVPMHPRPRVQRKQAHELVTTVTPGNARRSARNGFNAWFDEDPWWASLGNPPLWEADAPSLPRVGCDRPPFRVGSRTFRLARLGAAPAQGDALGYRDFGRPVAAWSSAGLNSPELLPARFPARTPLPSTASHPAVVTIANAPLTEAGRGEYNHRNRFRSSGMREEFSVVIPGRPPRQRRANPESLSLHQSRGSGSIRYRRRAAAP